MTTADPHSDLVGRSLPRVDARAKVTGTARYSAEYHPDQLVYAALVESTVPAGIIRTIDLSVAEDSPGVLLILTHLNAPLLPYGVVTPRPAVEPASGTQLRVLQDPHVRFSGQPIGVIAADSQARADHAASLVRVEYEPTRAQTRFDPTLANPTSDAADKLGRGPRTVTGDPDAALAAAAVRVDETYSQPREHHNAMEPHATVAQWHGDRLTLWSKTQWVDNERDTIAAIFGIPAADVRVINPYIGGAFGSALRTWPHVTLAALAARQLGRPVRLELTRRQLFTSIGFRPHTQQRVTLGAAADGQLLAHIQDAVGQTSTFEEFAEATLDAAQSTYEAANRRTTYQLVRMHTNTPCPMRGPGHATGLFAQEVAMDELAAALGMDPIALRQRNYAHRNPATNLPWSSNRLRECYETGAGHFGWTDRTPAPRSMVDAGDLVGFGMATAMNRSPRYPAQASATVHADGTATVSSATSDMGPGTYTAMTQIAAEVLRMPPERVRFILGDSTMPPAKEHGGSTTLASVGSAVQAAAGQLRRHLDRLAGLHGASPADTAGILGAADLHQLQETAAAEPGDEQRTHAFYSFGAVFAEVRVDPDLCTIRVPRIFGAYDIGRVVNPSLAHSQCIGGMVGGLGMALLEDTDWDQTLGRVANASLAEYLLPVCADVIDLDATFVPSDEPLANPLGTKGVAELGLCGVAPAIANAVWHATGTRVRDLPISIDKLLTATPTTQH